VATDYDGMAGTYEQHAAESSYNAHYDRPAVLELVGEVAGLRVLDAGCWPGLYAEELLARQGGSRRSRWLGCDGRAGDGRKVHPDGCPLPDVGYTSWNLDSTVQAADRLRRYDIDGSRIRFSGTRGPRRTAKCETSSSPEASRSAT